MIVRLPSSSHEVINFGYPKSVENCDSQNFKKNLTFFYHHTPDTTGMDRIGERLISSAGSLHGHPVWYDPRGRYTTEEGSGTGDFVFHRKRRSTCGMMVFLVCKSSRRPVLCTATATIAADGRIIKAPGDHCHLPELGGHGRRVRAVLETAKDSMRQEPTSNPTDQLLAARRNVPAEVAEFISLQSPLRTLRNHAAVGKSSLQSPTLGVSDTTTPSQEHSQRSSPSRKKNVDTQGAGGGTRLIQLEPNSQNGSRKLFVSKDGGQRGGSSRAKESTSSGAPIRGGCAPSTE